MIALVTGLIALRAGLSRGRVGRLRPVALAWVVALGLSAPAWLAIVEFNGWTARGEVSFFTLQFDHLLSPSHLPGLLFPGHRTRLDQEVGPASAFNAELVGGLVPVVVLLATRWGYGDWRFFGPFRGEAALTALACVLTMLPGVGPFRWSFRWLPLVFLAGGRASAGALARLRHRPPAGGAPNLGLWASAGVAAVWLLGLICGLDPTNFTVFVSLGTAGYRP
jgi:hypothetical protein